MNLLPLTIAAPLLGAIVASPLRRARWRRPVRIALGLGAVALAAFTLPGLDRLSAVFVVLISLLSFLALLFSTSIFPKVELADARWASRPSYFILLGAFWSSMLVVVTANNFVGIWVGISATTLATTFLVGFSGGKTAIEAAWKYLILCSFGIGIALIGMLLLGRAGMQAGIPPDLALSWNQLYAHAPQLQPPLARVALLLMLVGFATKAGLVPMHSWLPDAHSKAPAPISALLSGLLVSCSLYAIMRVQTVASGDGVAALFNNALLVFGGLSMLVATLLMLTQRDVKRLFSYSTVEHSGLVAIALSLSTPLGAFAALFHVVNHALAKSSAFLAVGVVQYTHGSTNVGDLRGLWNEGRGKLFLATLIALAGFPPFGLFLSELLVVLAAAAAHAWMALGVVLVALTIGLAAIARLAIESESGSSSDTRVQKVPWLAITATGCAAAAALFSVALPFVGVLR